MYFAHGNEVHDAVTKTSTSDKWMTALAIVAVVSLVLAVAVLVASRIADYSSSKKGNNPKRK